MGTNKGVLAIKLMNRKHYCKLSFTEQIFLNVHIKISVVLHLYSFLIANNRCNKLNQL